MVSCTVFWNKANLTLTQDVVFGKEVLYSGVKNTAENLPQITAHTDASVVIGVKFNSNFVDWGYKPLAPDLREAACL